MEKTTLCIILVGLLGGLTCCHAGGGPREGCPDCRQIRRGDCTPRLRREKCRPRCNSQEICCDNCCGGKSCVPKNTGDECSYGCSDEYSPICGSDGHTYDNGCKLREGICRNPDLTVDHKGECIDLCALVRCAHLECDLGFILTFDGEGCCPARCVPDCSAVLCALPNCPEESQIVDPEQPCCRICETEPDPCELQACILRLYDPVCGSDGVTYASQCQFDFEKRCNNPDLEIDHRGECEPDPCEPQACILLFDPICGSDGVTYGNQCQFDFEKRCNNPDLEIDHRGECEPDPCEPQACILIFDPICGSDGVTYGNQCQFDFEKRCNNPDLEIDHRGECEPDPCEPQACILLFDPICGSDGVTYGNQCQFDFAKRCKNPDLEIDHRGECEPDPCELQACNLLYDPICGSDGETYENQCHFDFEKRCKNPDLEIDHRGECDPCDHPRICTLEYNPICGSNGVTYGNKCQFEAARECIGPTLTLARYGRCDIPEECVDCALVDVLCTDEERNPDCDCSSDEVCCDDCCGGTVCQPRNDDPCRDIFCDIPVCPAGWALNYDGPGCCPTCIDCRAVLCPRPDCPEGSEIVDPEEGCCPVCSEIDPCRDIVCDPPACPVGLGPVNDDASCCPSCIDCRLVRCARPVCPEGSDIIEVEDRCCPVCSEIVKNGTCPRGKRRPCILDGPDDIPGCESDADCKGRQKCCPGVCRSICQDPAEDSLCPDGSNPVFCFVRPCQFATCEAYPDATCADNYCGGCIADWYVDGELVDCNVCSLPLDAGICLAAFRRWGFHNGRCEEFTYGGCGGNANNFETQSECEDACGGECPDGSEPVNCLISPCETATCVAFPDADCVDNFCGGCNADWFVDGEKVDCDNDVCSLPIAPGPCDAYVPSWGFQNGRCEEFIYGGCQGNGNRFPTEEECIEACRPNGCPDGSEPVNCLISPCETANCAAFPDADCVDNFCGGCNADWYVAGEKVDCDSDVCSLPVEPGPCRGSFPRWGFQNGRCEEFVYGGCQGNGNRFATEEDCVEECGQNVCSLPIEPGPCKAYVPSWGFENGRCKKFIYGGCQGNRNRFPTKAECLEECGLNECSLPIETGPCRGYFPRWGFENGRCKKFIYGGCHGNANRFSTKADCVEACGGNVCELPLVTGPCEALITRWGFRDDECVEFTYGGCQGNANNFESLDDCIDKCGPN